MARMTCLCGYHLSNSTEPEIDNLVFSLEKWAELLQEADETKGSIGMNTSDNYWKCPKCTRLYFFDLKTFKVKEIYQLEKRYNT